LVIETLDLDRIRIEKKMLDQDPYRIRIETTADPQHWLK
jgi:hypothetical protein